jgi:ferredoxin
VTSCKEWNTAGSAGPLCDENAYDAEPDRHVLQPRADLRGRRLSGHRDDPFPEELPALRRPAVRAGLPDRRELQAQVDGIVLVDYDKCIGCKYCAWACPYGARELDEKRQVMTKCTLCVDRIHDEQLAPADRQPACVKACPTGARLFGDIKDPLSEVSIAIRERGGYALMPEWNTRPANHYLPRRPTTAVGAIAPMPSERDRS